MPQWEGKMAKQPNSLPLRYLLLVGGGVKESFIGQNNHQVPDAERRNASMHTPTPPGSSTLLPVSMSAPVWP